MVIDVISPGETVNGKTLKDFIKDYWQALCQRPKNQNPVWQNDGNKDWSFNTSVNADLYMLSPSIDPQTTIKRHIRVQSNKGLFIPIMSIVVLAFQTFTNNLFSIANKLQSENISQRLHFELDGIRINNLNSYKFNPNNIDKFQVNFPSPTEAIFNINRSGTYDAVAAGNYVWTKPLSLGEHKVHFKGELRYTLANDVDPKYIVDMEYDITVDP
jgi:hypothetical protein